MLYNIRFSKHIILLCIVSSMYLHNNAQAQDVLMRKGDSDNGAFITSDFRLETLGTRSTDQIPALAPTVPAAMQVASFGADQAQQDNDFGEWDRKLVPQDEKSPKRGWSKTLARAEIAFQVLNVVDMGQTLKCMSRTDCEERNPILGKSPSKLAVVAFTAATGLLHYKLIKIISKKNRDMAKVVSFTILAGQGVVVGLNFKELY